MAALRVLAILALAAGSSAAYIEALYPLRQVLDEAEVVAEAVIESVDPVNRIAAARVRKVWKGTCAYDVLRMNLGTGDDWHPDVLLKHVVPGQPMLIFYNAERRAEAYLNRFFFQLYGDPRVAPDKAWWTFTHIEVRMNRTFNGSAAELAALLRDITEKRAPAPEPNPRRPAITRNSVRALPAPGQAVDETALPLPFLKEGPPRKEDRIARPVDERGFLGRWLLLGPIPLDPRAADPAEAVQKPFLEKAVSAPREFEKAEVDGAAFVWEPAEAVDGLLDFGAVENSLRVAACFVMAKEDLDGLTLLVGSGDSCRLVLNGKELHRSCRGRDLEADQDRVPGVSLRKGANLLQAWVVNGGGSSGLAVRFVDAAGAPLKALKTGLSPEAN